MFWLIQKNVLPSLFFRVFGAIVFGAMGLGNATAFAPDVGKATTSAKKIVQLLDSKPTIDYTSTAGNKLLVRLYIFILSSF